MNSVTLPFFIALLIIAHLLSANSLDFELFEEKNNEDLGKLLLVQFVFRHGDRTPISLYKNDPYKQYPWTEGLGQLTLRGKERMYRYGKVLNQRYQSYLADTPIRNVNARSSPKRRCLETTSALLAGLFPPRKSEIWSHNTTESTLAKLWQPIAIETKDPKRDWLLLPEAQCEAAEKEKARVFQLPFIKKFLNENAEFVKQVSNYTGDTYSSWVEVGYLYDTLFTEQHYFGSDYKRPEWLDLIGNNTMQRLEKFNRLEFTVFGSSKYYLRLRSGSLLKQIILNMNSTLSDISTNTQVRQLYTYGTHDTMISYLLLALGLPQGQPTYGSGVIFELRLDSHDNPFVRLLYANVTDNFTIKELKLNQSSTLHLCKTAKCQLMDFVNSLYEYLPVDIEQECSAGLKSITLE